MDSSEQPAEESVGGRITSSAHEDIAEHAKNTWGDLDTPLLLKIATFYIDSLPLPGSWERLIYVHPRNERCKSYKIFRKGFRLYDLMHVCTWWYRALREHPYWATFCARIRCDICRTISRDKPQWCMAYRVLCDHREADLYNEQEHSHINLLPAPSSDPYKVCGECLMFELPKEDLQLRPRIKHHASPVADGGQSASGFKENVFKVADGPGDSGGSPNCQCCRMDALENAARLQGLVSLDNCRGSDVFIELMVDTYIDTGCVKFAEIWNIILTKVWLNQNEIFRAICQRRYAETAQSSSLLQEPELYFSSSPAIRAFVTASPKLKRYMILEYQASTEYIQTLLLERILEGDWVSAIEPARPALLRADHPVRTAPVLKGRLRAITWVANAASLNYTKSKTATKVAPPCLESLPYTLRIAFREQHRNVLRDVLIKAMANVVSMISKMKTKPGTDPILPSDLDMERVIKYLGEGRFWRDPKTKGYYDRIPLVPTTLKDLPKSTVVVIKQTWKRACKNLFSSSEGSNSAASGSKRPRGDVYSGDNSRGKDAKRQKTS